MAMVDNGWQAAHAGGNHRRAAGHGLQSHQSEALIVGRHHTDIGCVVIEGQIVMIHPAYEVNQASTCRSLASCRTRSVSGSPGPPPPTTIILTFSSPASICAAVSTSKSRPF